MVIENDATSSIPRPVYQGPATSSSLFYQGVTGFSQEVDKMPTSTKINLRCIFHRYLTDWSSDIEPHTAHFMRIKNDGARVPIAPLLFQSLRPTEDLKMCQMTARTDLE